MQMLNSFKWATHRLCGVALDSSIRWMRYAALRLLGGSSQTATILNRGLFGV